MHKDFKSQQSQEISLFKNRKYSHNLSVSDFSKSQAEDKFDLSKSERNIQSDTVTKVDITPK